MSYIDDLNQAATEALAASSSATDSAQILSDVVNGADNVTVTTDNGEVKTVAKAIKDIIDAIETGVEGPQVEEQTLSTGQTTVSLSTIDTQGIALYIEGSRKFDFTVNDETSFELSQSFPDGTRIWIVKRDIEGAIDSFTVNSSTGTQTVKQALDQRIVYVNTIADLRALPVSELVVGQAAKITTTDRAGDFTWMAGDQSANVAGDPQEGIWVSLEGGNGSAGAWQRVFEDGVVKLVWWGMTGDQTSNLNSALRQFSRTNFNSNARGIGKLVLPKGVIEISGEVSMISPLGLIIEGAGMHTTTIHYTSSTGNLFRFRTYSNVLLRDFSAICNIGELPQNITSVFSNS